MSSHKFVFPAFGGGKLPHAAFFPSHAAAFVRVTCVTMAAISPQGYVRSMKEFPQFGQVIFSVPFPFGTRTVCPQFLQR